LARNFPDSPLAEKALFLAAKALSRSMDPDAVQQAVLLYEEVANGGGDLALRARFEQGLLQASLKKPKEAMAIFDKILASKPDTDLRLATLMEEGNTLYNDGSGDPANFQNAIAIWKQISDDTTAPRPWRDQALARMGMAYEKLGDNNSALACDYDVISAQQTGVPDFFWFYEAGFNAVRLLESQKLWNEAIKVYQKISAVDGPRAEEARDRMNRLRLENFIWD
jgi:tetratricopeptide (TPR) repeat protein